MILQKRDEKTHIPVYIRKLGRSQSKEQHSDWKHQLAWFTQDRKALEWVIETTQNTAGVYLLINIDICEVKCLHGAKRILNSALK